MKVKEEKPARTKEKPTPLSDRVYKKHRRMLGAIARHQKQSRAAALRYSIESTYERLTRKA